MQKAENVRTVHRIFKLNAPVVYTHMFTWLLLLHFLGDFGAHAQYRSMR